MQLDLNIELVRHYHSASQVARILTESWVTDNMFCPQCGHLHIEHFGNNRPVADFFCPICRNEYELKSKNGALGNKVADGAYETMIERITGNENPDFFFMNYSKASFKVVDFIFIPKYFFVPAIVEKRNPLKDTARRAGWVGCNILIGRIPEQGRIDIVSNGIASDITSVMKKVKKSARLQTTNIESRNWMMDVLNCINRIPTMEFTLDDIYRFDNILHTMHPYNNNIRPKIRQQLQVLRDRGFIEFTKRGKYTKIT